jgi:hypothetical protein
VALGAFA